METARSQPLAEAGRRVGIVFVHGIGAQAADTTLIDWVSPLIRAIVAWQEAHRHDLVGELRRDTRNRYEASRATGTGSGEAPEGTPLDPVLTARIDRDGQAAPVVRLRIPGLRSRAGESAGHPQEWLLTEAWWATRVEPPSFATMVDWCGRQGIVSRIARRIVSEDTRTSAGGSLARAFSAIGVGLFLSTMTTLALLLFGILKAIAAIVPIDAVKNATIFAAFETFLTSWWGDMYVLLRNPAQAASIRGRLAAAIRSLRSEGVDAVVVIGHSGGTIVSYTTLSDPGLASSPDGKPTDVRADLFVSHGEAINLARTLTDRVRASRRDGEDGRAVSMAAIPTADRTNPDGIRVGRWVDFRANRDPAPYGPLAEVGQTDAAEHPRVVDHEIWNRRSISEDHGGYWDNDEEFVLPVLRELDVAGLGTTAGASRFAHEPAAGEKDPWVTRHLQRVWVLAFWRRLMFVIPFAAILVALLRPDGFFTAVAGAGGAVFAFLGGTAAWDGVVSILEPNLPEWFTALQPAALVLAMIAFALMIFAALIHSIGPLGQREVAWQRQRWPGVLDIGASFIAPIGLAVAIAGGAHAPYEPIMACGTYGPIGPIPASSWCIDRYGLGGIAGLAIGLLLIGFAFIRLREPSLDEDQTGPQSSIWAGILTGGAILFVLAIFGAFLTDERTRIWVVGTVATALLFRRIDAYGTRRWIRWDENERELARRYDPNPPSRRWPAVQAMIVLVGAALVALGIALAPETLLGNNGWVLIVVGIGWLWAGTLVMTIVDGARSETSPTGTS